MIRINEQEAKAVAQLLRRAQQDVKDRGLPMPCALRLNDWTGVAPEITDPPGGDDGKAELLVTLFRGGALHALNAAIATKLPQVGERWGMSYLSLRDREPMLVLEVVKFTEPATTASLFRSEMRLEIHEEMAAHAAMN